MLEVPIVNILRTTNHVITSPTFINHVKQLYKSHPQSNHPFIRCFNSTIIFVSISSVRISLYCNLIHFQVLFTGTLTHWGRVMHICVSKLTIKPLSHYLNQCWKFVNLNLRNKIQWNLKRNSCIFIQENAFQNVVCEMASILPLPQCVNSLHPR